MCRSFLCVLLLSCLLLLPSAPVREAAPLYRADFRLSSNLSYKYERVWELE